MLLFFLLQPFLILLQQLLKKMWRHGHPKSEPTPAAAGAGQYVSGWVAGVVHASIHASRVVFSLGLILLTAEPLFWGSMEGPGQGGCGIDTKGLTEVRDLMQWGQQLLRRP